MARLRRMARGLAADAGFDSQSAGRSAGWRADAGILGGKAAGPDVNKDGGM